MKPTVGRIVHYYERTEPSDGAAYAGPFPAIIGVPHSDICCTLSVFKPWQTSVWVASSCQRKDVAGNSMCYWEWPPRE